MTGMSDPYGRGPTAWQPDLAREVDLSLLEDRIHGTMVAAQETAYHTRRLARDVHGLVVLVALLLIAAGVAGLWLNLAR